jgi:hypothetical protein
MREAINSRRVWDVKVELQEVATALLSLRETCEQLLKTPDKLSNALDVRKSLRSKGAPNFIKDATLSAVATAMMEAKGTFNLLATLKQADTSFAALVDAFGQQAPLNTVTPITLKS